MRSTIECFGKIEIYCVHKSSRHCGINALIKIDNNCVIVDLLFMKRYCFDDKRFSALMWVIIESLAKGSINLHTIDVKLMGL